MRAYKAICCAPLSGRRGLLIAASLLALSGCVSSTKVLESAVAEAQTADPATVTESASKQTVPASAAEIAATDTAASGNEIDPLVSATPAPAGSTIAGAATTAPADIGGLALQPTGVNANTRSIFSAPRPATGVMTAPAVNPMASSVFSSTQPAAADPVPTAAAPGDLSMNTGGKRKSMALAMVETAKPYLGDDDLPGGFASGLYSLGNKDDIDDDQPAGLMKLASLSGLARTAAHGLKVQGSSVEVGCFKPELVNMIKSIERHFGRTALVTSGYRDIGHNRRVGGVEGSLHTSCNAADVQVAGVSKWELASFARDLPGRGGVGTYCHTASIHIDTGTQRDWNWRCRRKDA